MSTEKFHMMMTEGIMSRHYTSADEIKVDPMKIEVILKNPTPKIQKELRILLGHARYYKRFIEDFSKIESPLFSLLMKDVEFLWTGKCDHIFLELKCCASATPALCGINWELPFHIATDPSNIDVCVVLG